MSKLDKSTLTHEFVKNLDQNVKPVWLRDDYLCMRDYALMKDKDGKVEQELFDYLDKLAEVKEEMREAGYTFIIDTL